MSRRSSTTGKVPQPPKPLGVELQRSVRPSHLIPSSTQSSTKAVRVTKSSLGEDNNSPMSSPHTSARENEPATDEESQLDGSAELVKNLDLDIAERQALDMLEKITKRSERNHRKYDAFRDSMSGKDKQIDELHASFEMLIQQTASLEALCNRDMDPDTLEKLFQTIPLQQRKLQYIWITCSLDNLHRYSYLNYFTAH